MGVKISKNGESNGLFSIVFLALLISLFVLIPMDQAKAQTNKIYITHPQHYDEGRSSVSIINLNQKSRVADLDAAQGTGLAVYIQKRGYLYLFSSIKNLCQVFDPVVDRKLFEFETGGPVADAVLSPDGSRLFIANGGETRNASNTVTMVDAADGRQLYGITVGKNPVTLEVSVDGRVLYVGDDRTGTVNIVDLNTFETVGSFYGGANPTDMELSWDGRDLIIASKRLDDDLDFGAGLAVVNLGNHTLKGLFSTTFDVTGIEVLNQSRLVCLVSDKGRPSLRFFDYSDDGNVVKLAESTQVPFSGSGSDLELTRDRKNILVTESMSGKLLVVDPSTYRTSIEIGGLVTDKLGGMVVVPVDFQKQLNRRDSIITYDPESNEARQAYFEKAYIYRTMGDKNSEIKIYTDLAGAYPGTETEINSFLRLGDLCYNDQLYANSADFYTQAFKAYIDYLESRGGRSNIDDHELHEAVRRLGNFSAEYDKDYLQNIASSLETLTISSDQLAELYFLLAYYLKKQGDTKMSRRLIDEAERQMISFNDPPKYKKLRDKIDLLNSEGRIILTAEDVKRGPMIDGDLADWKDKNTLFLDRRTDLLVNGHQWIDDRDLSMEVRAVYDKENLYLMGIVRDNRLFEMGDTKRDRVRMYIDMNEGSGQFIRRDDQDVSKIARLEILPPVNSSSFDFNHSENIHPIFAARKSENGYQFEVKIPFVYLKGIAPEGGSRFGFGIELWDADSDMPGDPLKIMGWVAPTATISGDRDFRMLGILELD